MPLGQRELAPAFVGVVETQKKLVGVGTDCILNFPIGIDLRPFDVSKGMWEEYGHP